MIYEEEGLLKDRLERESLRGARWRLIDRCTVDFEIQTRLDAGAIVTVRSDAERFSYRSFGELCLTQQIQVAFRDPVTPTAFFTLQRQCLP